MYFQCTKREQNNYTIVTKNINKVNIHLSRALYNKLRNATTGIRLKDTPKVSDNSKNKQKAYEVMFFDK